MMTLISMLGHPPRCRIGDDPAVLSAHSPQYDLAARSTGGAVSK
jgi:hypothetical protein